MREGWNLKQLSEVCGYDKTKHNREELPYVGLEHIESHTGNFLGTLEPFEVKSSTFSFTSSHLLYGRLRPYLNKVLMPDFEGHCSTEIFPIQLSDKILREYLFYWFIMDSTVAKINATWTGARMPRANMKQVITFQIPIPPLSEQKQIVAILDKAFAAIDQAKANIEKNIENAKELFQSKLNDIFSQKGDGWEEKTIEKVSNVVNGCSFKSGDFSADNEVKSIKITNVGIMEFVEDSSNRLPSSFSKKYSKVKVHEGDLVLALTRTIISGGLKVARVPKSYHHSLLNQRVAAIVPNTELIDSDYLYYYFSSNIVYNYVLDNVNTLMQPNLSIGDLKKMPVPITSLKSQIKISQQIENLSESVNLLIDNFAQKLNDLEELKKSILQKAFAGELTQKMVAV
jgi:type I restriction enzyme S subunit